LRPALATQERLTDYKSVNVFLSSILRNSQRSKYAYQYGLVHFQKFIVLKYPQYDIETILKPLSKNKLNIYTILDADADVPPTERLHWKQYEIPESQIQLSTLDLVFIENEL